jgi:hypothetical protein
MQSKAKDLTTYIEEAPSERQEALVRLRDLCREILTGLEETMGYGGLATNGMRKWKWVLPARSISSACITCARM